MSVQRLDVKIKRLLMFSRNTESSGGGQVKFRYHIMAFDKKRKQMSIEDFLLPIWFQFTLLHEFYWVWGCYSSGDLCSTRWIGHILNAEEKLVACTIRGSSS